MDIKLPVEIPKMDELVKQGKDLFENLHKRGRDTIDQVTATTAKYAETAWDKSCAVLPVDAVLEHEMVKKAITEVQGLSERMKTEAQAGLDKAHGVITPAVNTIWQHLPENVRNAWTHLPETTREMWDHLPAPVKSMAEKLPPKMKEFAGQLPDQIVAIFPQVEEEPVAATKEEVVEAVEEAKEKAEEAEEMFPPPVEGYDEMNVHEAVALLEESAPAMVKKIRDYEIKTKNRVTVLKAVEKILNPDE